MFVFCFLLCSVAISSSNEWVQSSHGDSDRRSPRGFRVPTEDDFFLSNTSISGAARTAIRVIPSTSASWHTINKPSTPLVRDRVNVRVPDSSGGLCEPKPEIIYRGE